jgi:SAM-dependent methyltransferase
MKGFSNLNEDDLGGFLSVLPWGELQEAAAPFFSNSADKAAGFLETLKAEAKLGFRLVKDSLVAGQRVLEVGSGMGLLAGYLNSRGVDITALEPGLGGFSFSAALAKAVQKCPEFATLKRLDIPADCLSKKLHGEFDFIYSVNVLEHIPELEIALKGMAGVLAPNGKMVNTCPNYTVPYEPHFGIPLVPFFPRISPMFFPKCRGSELWGSLNFITSRWIKKICRRNGLKVSFEGGILYRTLLRLEEEPEFLKRQSNPLILGIFRLLKITGLLKLTQFMPASLSTPMIYEIRMRPLLNEESR